MITIRVEVIEWTGLPEEREVIRRLSHQGEFREASFKHLFMDDARRDKLASLTYTALAHKMRKDKWPIEAVCDTTEDVTDA